MDSTDINKIIDAENDEDRINLIDTIKNTSDNFSINVIFYIVMNRMLFRISFSCVPAKYAADPVNREKFIKEALNKRDNLLSFFINNYKLDYDYILKIEYNNDSKRQLNEILSNQV